MPCGRSVPTGSIEGRLEGFSPVPPYLTQSLDPASGTSSTLKPPNQPYLLAIANGAAAEVMVLAQKPTRTVSSAFAFPAASATSAAAAISIQRFIVSLSPPCFPAIFSPTDPRTAPGGAPAG